MPYAATTGSSLAVPGEMDLSVGINLHSNRKILKLFGIFAVADHDASPLQVV
jgi:hypothetical protein